MTQYPPNASFLDNNCRRCGMPHGSSSLWCSPKCQEAGYDRQMSKASLIKHISTTQSCINCEYEGHVEPCMFPDPQKGGEAPSVATVKMTNSSNAGANCGQFRRAANLDQGKTT